MNSSERMNINLEKGRSALLVGPAKLMVIKGALSIFGATLRGATSFAAIAGRQYPIVALEDSEFVISLGIGSRFERFDRDPIPSDWRAAAELISRLSGTIVVLGDVDAGKSGFTLYAANALISKGRRVAIVDTDVGQSDIGPPGTIGMSILDKQYPSYPDVPLTDAYFIGDKSPVGHLLPMVVGARAVADKALALGADVVIVNTTGLVHGGVAAALKYNKIENLRPALIVALQRESEIEHLLKPHEGYFTIARLKTPSHVAKRGREERAEFRSLRMGHYLMSSKVVTLDLRSVTLLNTSIGYGERDAALESAIAAVAGCAPSSATKDGKSVTVTFDILLHPAAFSRTLEMLKASFDQARVICTPKLRGLLVGLLNFKREFLCVGVLDEMRISDGKLKIRVPISDPSKVKYVSMGYLILDEYGNEVASIRPGEI